MMRLLAALSFTVAAFGVLGCASYGGDDALDTGHQSMANSIAASAASGGAQPEGTLIRSSK